MARKLRLEYKGGRLPCDESGRIPNGDSHKRRREGFVHRLPKMKRRQNQGGWCMRGA